MQAARNHFANISLLCIEDALNGTVHGTVKVNNVNEYVAWQREGYEACLLGKYDHTFTLRQYAAYVQSGECHALLPI